MIVEASEMYGGKSTFAGKIGELFGRENVICFVPDFMNKDSVTVRGRVD